MKWLIPLLAALMGCAMPDEALLMARRGEEAYRAGMLGDAEVYYRRALGQDSASWQVPYNLGNVLYRQERYGEALSYYEMARDLSDPPSRAGILHNIGNTNLKLKQLDRSAEAYRQALKLRPRADATRYNLAYVQHLRARQTKDPVKKPGQQGNQARQHKEKSQDGQHQEDNSGVDNRGAAPNEKTTTEKEMEVLFNLLQEDERKVLKKMASGRKQDTRQANSVNDW